MDVDDFDFDIMNISYHKDRKLLETALLMEKVASQREERNLYKQSFSNTEDELNLQNVMSHKQEERSITCRKCNIQLIVYITPGSEYSCPDCNIEIDLKDYCFCGLYVETTGVQCPDCTQWYHYPCVGFTEWTHPSDWKCYNCSQDIPKDIFDYGIPKSKRRSKRRSKRN